MVKSDIALHRDVAEELAFDPSVDEKNIAVAVNGGIVTLSGNVDSYAQELAAERAVKRVRGVHGIAEELRIEIPATHRRDDADLVSAALNALRWNASVPADAILVTVEAGWMTLTGTVDWQFEREAARVAVASLAGVIGVSNEIVLRQRVIAQDVKTKIHDSLLRQAESDANRINVETSGTTVTLRGRVHSWTERDDAASAAYSVPGVLTVNNLTTVS